MTPQLQQAIKLLQLSNLELSQHLQEQVDENPFLGGTRMPVKSPQTILEMVLSVYWTFRESV